MKDETFLDNFQRNIASILTLVIITGVLAMLTIVLINNINNAEVLNLIVGPLIAMGGSLTGYYFRGAEDKRLKDAEEKEKDN